MRETMSEPLLSDARLASELDFFKHHADSIAQNKIKLPSSYVPAVKDRPRKATLVNVPVVEAPTPSIEDDSTPTNDEIELTVKSLKPALSFSLKASPTSTIQTLKMLLVQQNPTAPAPEQQRWILKGKSMGDTKLLREFAVENGSVVNLMITKAAAQAQAADPEPTEATATPAGASTTLASTSSALSPPSTPAHGGTASGRHSRVPSLTLSEPPEPYTPSRRGSSAGSHRSVPSLSITTDLLSSPLSLDSHQPASARSAGSDEFIAGVSNPTLWTEAFELLKRHFEGDESKAQSVWESWLSGSRDWISPGDKALIRSKAGVSAMGGY
ncbi:BQ2448_6754 [Microbotryum intermedium]|uniref:BQ2448_6754 protein n=1 Tax=Microbotryum intermedium TaxID=269621 RepID=A0A238FKK7_9BASI|nr:BQ2448_6754 [Microbotryum intermedium]